MMPGNVLSNPTLNSAFLAPRGQITKAPNPPVLYTPLIDYSIGGVGLDDPSQGLALKTWQASVDGSGNVVLSAASVTPTTVFTRAGITWIGLAFDSNMKVFLAWLEAAGAFFRWFDSIANAYTITQLPAGSDKVFAQLDDTRPLESSKRDVLLHYQRSNRLLMRIQRDRYGVEYDLGDITGLNLVQTGMNHTNRFQFQLG